VTRGAVQRLGLALDEWVDTRMRGVSGFIEQHPNARPRSFSLGGIPLRRPTVTHDVSLTVATLPAVTPDNPIDGVLGRDFLKAFDLGLDLQALTLTLFDVRDCHGRFLPWTTPYAALPVDLPMGRVDPAVIVAVQIDGVRLRALLDTGAARSLVIAPGRNRLGLTAERLADATGGQAAGLGPRALPVQAYRFGAMTVGTDTWQHPTLMVGDARMGGIDMVLGNDWLAGRRIWLSYATLQVFMAQ
jgi:hypothetical protein